MNILLRVKHTIQARWHIYKLRRLLHRAARVIPKAVGETEDFVEILKIWEKQLTIAASNRPKYWKESVQKDLEQEFEFRYNALIEKFALRAKDREKDL